MGTAMCSVLAEEAYSKRKSCSPSSVIRPLLLATAVIQIAAADLRSKTLPNDRATNRLWKRCIGFLQAAGVWLLAGHVVVDSWRGGWRWTTTR